MASINHRKNSRTWTAVFRDGIGRKIARSTRVLVNPLPAPGEGPAEIRIRKTENTRLAQRLADEWEAAARGNRTERELMKTFKDVTSILNKGALDFPKAEPFLNGWLAGVADLKSPKTFERYSGAVKPFLASLTKAGRAGVLLSDVRPEDLETFLRERIKSGRATSTARADLKILNIPFGDALRKGKITTNPVAAVKLPAAGGESRIPFTFAEIDALLKEASPEWQTAILLGAFAGMRLGDACGLGWQNLDLLAKTITFRPSKTRKTKADLVLPLHPRIEKHLLAMPSPDDANTLLCPRLSKCKPSGRSGLSREFLEILRTAGIEQNQIAANEGGKAFNRKSFHSLRHTYVTELERAGVAPDIRMKLAGHSDSRSHATYTHTERKTLRNALERLGT